MSPLETDRFLASMRASFRSYIDEFRGPYRGPGGPHMRISPDPEPWQLAHPWRELGVAYEAAKLADAFELAVEGTGVSYMKRFADDPEFPCGTRPPGWPRPKKDDERFLEPEVLGAALDFVAEGVGNEEVAGAARELGRGMIG